MTAAILDMRGNPYPASSMSSYASEYEGAGVTRRFGETWGLGVSGPSASLTYSLSSLRSRSRKLAMNEPQIDGGLDTLAANMIGTGITPRWQLKDSGLKREIQELWADWAKEADADEATDYYGLQTLAARSMIESGENLCRYVPRRVDANMSVPFQLQLLEADHLDETFSSINPQNGNEIRFGIEFNSRGQRVAYHIYKEHPAEMFLMGDNTTRIRIPASQMRHIYRPLRPGQKRGRPWLASVILAMHELSKYDDAEVVRKTAAAMFGGFITSTSGTEGGSRLGIPTMVDSQNRDIVALEPGTFPKLPQGMDVKFSEPADVGGNYEAFTKRQDRRIARGFGGLSYEKYSGDLTDASYSSIRTGTLAEQRIWKMVIYNVMVPQFCQPSAAYFIRQAVLSGTLNIKDFQSDPRKYLRIKWCIDGWAWVDPLKDVMAEKVAMRSGLKSRAESASERGRDVEEVDAEIASDNERSDKAGLIFDTDPRQQAANGAARQKPI